LVAHQQGKHSYQSQTSGKLSVRLEDGLPLSSTCKGAWSYLTVWRVAD